MFRRDGGESVEETAVLPVKDALASLSRGAGEDDVGGGGVDGTPDEPAIFDKLRPVAAVDVFHGLARARAFAERGERLETFAERKRGGGLGEALRDLGGGLGGDAAAERLHLLDEHLELVEVHLTVAVHIETVEELASLGREDALQRAHVREGDGHLAEIEETGVVDVVATEGLLDGLLAKRGAGRAAPLRVDVVESIARLPTRGEVTARTPGPGRVPKAYSFSRDLASAARGPEAGASSSSSSESYALSRGAMIARACSKEASSAAVSPPSACDGTG